MHINFKIPDVLNPLGEKRQVQRKRPGSSLPLKLTLRDARGLHSVRTLSKAGPIAVENLEVSASDDDDDLYSEVKE